MIGLFHSLIRQNSENTRMALLVDIAQQLELLRKNDKEQASIDAANNILALSEASTSSEVTPAQGTLPVGLSGSSMARIVLDWACRICVDVNKAYAPSNKTNFQSSFFVQIGCILVRSLELHVPGNSSSMSTNTELNNTTGQAVISFLILSAKTIRKEEIDDFPIHKVSKLLFSLPLYQPTVDVLLEFIVNVSEFTSHSHGECKRLTQVLIDETCASISRQSNQRKVFERVCSSEVLLSLFKLHKLSSTGSGESGNSLQHQISRSIEKLITNSIYNDEMINGLHSVATLRFSKFLSSINGDAAKEGIDEAVALAPDERKTKRRKRKDGTSSSAKEHSESFHVCLLKSLSSLINNPSVSQYGAHGYELIFRLCCRTVLTASNPPTLPISTDQKVSTLASSGKRTYSSASSHAARLTFEFFVMLAQNMLDDSSRGSGLFGTKPNATVMLCLSSLLRSVNTYNCYRIHEDTSQRHLQCLQACAKVSLNVLLQTGESNVEELLASFNCIGSLLSLTHLTILADIQSILSTLISCVVMDSALSKASTFLFCKFIDSFSKLRKLPDILDALFTLIFEKQSISCEALAIVKDPSVVAELKLACSRNPIGQLEETMEVFKRHANFTVAQGSPLALKINGDEVVLSILEVWLVYWPVDTIGSASYAGSLISKCASHLLTCIALRSFLSVVTMPSGSVAKFDLTTKVDVIYSLKWYAQLVVAASKCEELLPRGIEDALPPLFSQFFNVASGGSLIDDAVSHITEADLLGLILKFLITDSTLSSLEKPLNLSNTIEQLALVRLSQIHAQLGRLPLCQDSNKHSIEVQLREEARTLLDVLFGREDASDVELLLLTSRLLSVWSPLASDTHIKRFLQALIQDACSGDKEDSVGGKVLCDASFWEFEVVQQWFPFTCIEFALSCCTLKPTTTTHASPIDALSGLVKLLQVESPLVSKPYDSQWKQCLKVFFASIKNKADDESLISADGMTTTQFLKLAQLGALLNVVPLKQTAPQHLLFMIMCGVTIDLILDTQSEILETSWHATCLASWRIVTGNWIHDVLTNTCDTAGIPVGRLEELFQDEPMTWTNYFIYQSKQSNIVHDGHGNGDNDATRASQYSGKMIVLESMSSFIFFIASRSTSKAQEIFKTLHSSISQCDVLKETSNKKSNKKTSGKQASSDSATSWLGENSCVHVGALKGLALVAESLSMNELALLMQGSVDSFCKNMVNLASSILNSYLDKQSCTKSEELPNSSTCLHLASIATLLEVILKLSKSMNKELISCELIARFVQFDLLLTSSDDNTATPISISICMKAYATLAYVLVSPPPDQSSHVGYSISQALLPPLLHYTPNNQVSSGDTVDNQDQEDIYTMLCVAFQRTIRNGLVPIERVALLTQLSRLHQDQSSDVSALRCLALAIDACCAPTLSCTVLNEATTIGGLHLLDNDEEDDNVVTVQHELDYGLPPQDFSTGQTNLEKVIEQLSYSLFLHYGNLKTYDSLMSARYAIKQVEAVVLCMDSIRSLLGIRGLLQLGHRLVSFAMTAASQAIASSTQISKLMVAHDEGSVSYQEQTRWVEAATVSVWGVEKACMLVSKLLKTHTRLVYSVAPQLTQVHMALLHTVDAFVCLHGTFYTLVPSDSTKGSMHKPLVVDLVARVARSSSRLLSDCCHEKHLSTFRRHFPPLFVEFVNVVGSWDMSKNDLGRAARKDLHNGYLTTVGVLGPKDTQHITTLLTGGPHDTPRAVFKELLEEHAKVNKFTGRF